MQTPPVQACCNAPLMKRRALTSSVELACPFCGEVSAITIDEGGGEHQTFVEDCTVCCRPRVVHFESSGEEQGEVNVWLEREDD